MRFNKNLSYAYFLSLKYRKQFNQDFKQYTDSLEGGLTAELKAEFIATHLDKSKAYGLDTELLDKILAFYHESIGTSE